MRLVKLLHVLCILIFGIAFASIPAAVTAQNTVTPAAMTKTYCAPCHSGQAPPGRLSLDQLDANPPSEAPETWERVVRQLRARTMPPMAAPRPDSKTYESTIAALTLRRSPGMTHVCSPGITNREN